MKLKTADLIASVLRVGFMTSEEIAKVIGISTDDAEATLLDMKLLGVASNQAYGSLVFWSLVRSASAPGESDRPLFDNSAFTMKPPSLKEFRRFKKRVDKEKAEDKSWNEWADAIKDARKPS